MCIRDRPCFATATGSEAVLRSGTGRGCPSCGAGQNPEGLDHAEKVLCQTEEILQAQITPGSKAIQGPSISRLEAGPQPDRCLAGRPVSSHLWWAEAVSKLKILGSGENYFRQVALQAKLNRTFSR